MEIDLKCVIRIQGKREVCLEIGPIVEHGVLRREALEILTTRVVGDFALANDVGDSSSSSDEEPSEDISWSAASDKELGLVVCVSEASSALILCVKA